MTAVYLGLGSNLGDRAANLAAARRGVERMRGTALLKNAPTYETTPVGGPAGQGLFLNSASLVETALSPREFLREIHAVERALGRERGEGAVRWGPRPIDIDILLWGGAVLDGEDLVIPHPRMAERLFVLLPLADLDENAMHPVLRLTAGQLLERLNGNDAHNEGIRRLPL